MNNSMNAARPASGKLVVVLGMHRSGTSAMTRAMKALGAEPGDHPLPPAAALNDKGLFEDADVAQINQELLSAGGAHWHTVGEIELAGLAPALLDALRARGVNVLRAKCAGRTFALRDPRLTRLLPFWQLVFKEVGVPVVYAVAVRDPISVARALAKRDHMTEEQAYPLWLAYMVAALRDTHGSVRAFFDYASMVLDPAGELAKLANRLQLPVDAACAGDFAHAFLEQELPHPRFSTADLTGVRAAPSAVKALFAALETVCRAGEEDAALQSALERGQQFLADVEPLLRVHHDTTLLRATLEASKLVMADRDKRIAELQQQLANGPVSAQAGVGSPAVAGAAKDAAANGAAAPQSLVGSPIVAAAMAAAAAKDTAANGAAAPQSLVGSPIVAAAMAAAAAKDTAANGAAAPQSLVGSPIVAAAMAAAAAKDTAANGAAVPQSPVGSPIVAAAMAAAAAKKAAAENAATRAASPQSPVGSPIVAAAIAKAAAPYAPHAPAAQPTARPRFASRGATLYSFVVDTQPRFAYEGYHLARSLIEHGCEQASDINVQFTPEVDASTRALFRELGCTLHDIERFGDGRHCNKIAQLANLHPFDFDHVVLLDTDMIALADPRPNLDEHALVGKVTDLAHPPLPVLEEIARAAGMRDLPPMGTVDAALEPTFAGYCNGGFYGIPKGLAQIVDQSWRHWAQWLLAHNEPLMRNGMSQHVDQISMWLAIVMDRIPYSAAPSNVNYTVHLNSEHRYFDRGVGIEMIRYHESSLDALGKLQVNARHNELERRAIEAANRLIGAGVENPVFQSLRDSAAQA
ncbi:sulfotransferase family protein [Paraburkholderia solisilvae]|uniref:Uncharacterized protein n=1 Tax=Paraburkholderia solisilvae TaxID=624376 RepID=A0A6J5ENI1_9BURK|nr:hypothetical protein [Paraburkholderia solisilvae]CAB3768118.1 hypothetical protein LMG29739_05239 [Paraburkholderia solisilvae]